MLCTIGGWDGESVIQSAEWYDPETTQWHSGPPLNCPRKRLGVASVEGKVYAVGGHDGRSTLDSVEVYGQQTREWVSLPAMNQPRMFAACVTLDGKLYAIGGQSTLGVPLASAEVFDPVHNQWQLIANMHCNLASPVAATHKQTVYVLGRGRRDLYTLQIYTPPTDTWTHIPTTLPYHMYAEAVYCGSSLYILCGGGSCRRERESQCSVYCYDLDTNRWSVECQMLRPRAGFAAAEVNGCIAVVGGHRGREKLSWVDLYDPEAREWHQLPAMSGGGRCVLGAVGVKQLAVI